MFFLLNNSIYLHIITLTTNKLLQDYLTYTGKRSLLGFSSVVILVLLFKTFTVNFFFFFSPFIYLFFIYLFQFLRFRNNKKKIEKREKARKFCRTICNTWEQEGEGTALCWIEYPTSGQLLYQEFEFRILVLFGF